MNTRKYWIIVLTLATALVHLVFLNVIMGSLSIPFTLNGLGYLALLAAYILPLPFSQDNRGLVRWALMGFTAVTIVAWIVIGDKSLPGGILGYVTKLIEVGLIAVLWGDRQNSPAN